VYALYHSEIPAGVTVMNALDKLIATVLVCFTLVMCCWNSKTKLKWCFFYYGW